MSVIRLFHVFTFKYLLSILFFIICIIYNFSIISHYSLLGLLVSITPLSVLSITPAINATFLWMISLGDANDGLRRTVTQILIKSTEDLSAVRFPTTTATTSSSSSSANSTSPTIPTTTSSTDWISSYITSTLFTDNRNQFPSTIQHLNIHIPERVLTSSNNNVWERPFTRCPNNVLAVLVMASPYFNPVLAERINNLVIIYQQDTVFKKVFSQVLTILYPALYGLYCRAIGK